MWANVGGLMGSVLLGLLSHRFSLKAMLLVVMVASGVVGLYALFAKSFPVEVRATGTGFAIGVGRCGAALSPVLAGFLFTFGYSLAAVSATIVVSSLLVATVLAFFRASVGQETKT